MGKDTLNGWETRFRLEAKADGFAGLERFVERLTDRADGALLGSGVGEKLARLAEQHQFFG